MNPAPGTAKPQLGEIQPTRAELGLSAPSVPPGYKQTEVGVIPADWENVPLGELAQFITSGSCGWAEFYSESGALFIRSQNVRDGRLSFEDTQYVRPPSGAEGNRTKVKRNDVLITITGNSVGNVALVEREFDEAYISQHVGMVRLHEVELGEYVCRYLSPNSPGNPQIAGSQSGQSKPGLNLQNLRDFRIAVPPTLPEQRTIAAALSDVDALLASLDRLIAKKRDLKQAAMQQLLTGQTRLPGFHEEWVVKRLGEICEIAMGRTPPRLNQAFWGTGFVWLSIADLQSKVVTQSKEQVTELAASTMTIIPKGTLLMSFKLSIGRLCFAGCDLFTNEAICSFNKLQADADYLYYALGRTDFSLYGKQAVKGYTLNKESLKIVEVLLPPLPEQTAIAAVLTEMDAELAALEQRQAKTRALKQGMMQELLTGRTRLPGNAEPQLGASMKSK